MLTVRLLADVVIEWSIDQRRPVTWLELLSPRKNAWLVQCRQLLYWLARDRTTLSHAAIAQAIGGRDHTTIVHGVKRIEELRAIDPAVAEACVHLVAAADALVGLGVANQKPDRSAPDIAARILTGPGRAAHASVEDIIQLAAAFADLRERRAARDLDDHWIGLMDASAEASAAMTDALLRRGTPQENAAWTRLARASQRLRAARALVADTYRHTEAGQLLAAE